MFHRLELDTKNTLTELNKNTDFDVFCRLKSWIIIILYYVLNFPSPSFSIIL